MKTISIFNNKGGVGKTNLTFHMANALAEMGYKTLIIDLDPQCNLTLYGLEVEKLHSIWDKEDAFIDAFDFAKSKMTKEEFMQLNSEPRTIHYLLKPTEEGTGDIENLPPAIEICPNLDLIPGRLTLHMYENKITSRWSDAFQGEPLALRTITKIRALATEYAEKEKYEFVIMDTSPSLGSLNKAIISTVDGFVIPFMQDMFSLYGIRNIGNALSEWRKNYEIIQSLISEQKRNLFPSDFVKFLGYTVYNAKKYTGKNAEERLGLAQAHFNYVRQIPETIEKYIEPQVRKNLDSEMLNNPIGMTSVMHSHNTLPAMAQKYKSPIWKVPSLDTLSSEDRSTIIGNKGKFEESQNGYREFTEDLLLRLKTI